MKLKLFKAPANYSDYTFWRASHQRWAVITMVCAAVYAINILFP
jgi:hypothetical protein